MTSYAKDYATYSQIKWELHRPIHEDGVDYETLRRLYESKIIYLERLRVQCFYAMNQNSPNEFSMHDYNCIFLALQTTKAQAQKLNVLR